MANIDDLRAQLQQLQQDVLATLPEMATAVSSSAKALSERTIKERGFGAQYSKNKIPVWFFKGKELNAGGRAYLESHGVNVTGEKKKRKKKGEEKPMDKLGTWGEFREAQGLQTGHVDATYRGKTFASIKPQNPEFLSETVVIAPLAATGEEAKILGYLYEMYGDFIIKALTDEDFEKLQEVARQGIIDIFSLKLKKR